MAQMWSIGPMGCKFCKQNRRSQVQFLDGSFKLLDKFFFVPHTLSSMTFWCLQPVGVFLSLVPLTFNSMTVWCLPPPLCGPFFYWVHILTTPRHSGAFHLWGPLLLLVPHAFDNMTCWCLPPLLALTSSRPTYLQEHDILVFFRICGTLLL